MSYHLCDDGGASHLAVLQHELAKHGLKSELDTRAAFPRLRVLPSDMAGGYPDVAEFENSIIVSYFGHDLWYAWPWVEPIARVAQVERAASEIVEAVGADDDQP